MDKILDLSEQMTSRHWAQGAIDRWVQMGGAFQFRVIDDPTWRGVKSTTFIEMLELATLVYRLKIVGGRFNRMSLRRGTRIEADMFFGPLQPNEPNIGYINAHRVWLDADRIFDAYPRSLGRSKKLRREFQEFWANVIRALVPVIEIRP